MGRLRQPPAWSLTVLVALAGAFPASAAPTLQEYRHFRALSIDLAGRMPTRDEVAAFERGDFQVDTWIDERLGGRAYAERLRRVYMDLLRLEIGGSFQFVPNAIVLRRQRILGPDGAPLSVYFREGQRRTRAETDGTFCLTQAETGLQFPRYYEATGTPNPVTQEALDARTVVVRPWWLYRDYRAESPTQRYGDAWPAGGLFVPVPGLLNEPDGGPPVAAIRVCREEAQTAETGTVLATGRTTAPPAGTPPPYGRLTQLPLDSAFARAHTGEPISCLSGSAFPNSADCGCGPGLERCMPGDGASQDPRAFAFPTRTPLGLDQPLDQAPQAQSSWHRFWWSQEAVRFLDDLFASDRDLREMLSGRHTWVNGPVAQFYRSTAGVTCCGNGTQLGYVEPEPLFDRAGVPASLRPHDTGTWQRVDDRGPRASGILTMPIFLTKYGTRRARAHVLYNAFLCREFVSGNVALTPSTEPNLMVRPGCSTCHATLEPLAAYFVRVMESDWTYLPAEKFPVYSTTCKGAEPSRIPGYCRAYYDPAFTDAQRGTLRGAYASREHAEAGPAGIAAYVTQSPEFPPCVARNLFTSFLGRVPTSDDGPLLQDLANALVAGGYRMRPVVRALVRSEAYRRANNLSSSAWRNGGAP